MKALHFAFLCWCAVVMPQLALADLSSTIINAIPPEKRDLIEAAKLAELLREIDAARVSGSKLDESATARLESSLALAHEHGLPLALMLYNQLPDDEAMRLALSRQILRPDAAKTFSWDSLEILVEGFLIARDPPVSVFKTNHKQQGLDDFVRTAVLRRVVEIVNPAENPSFAEASPKRLIEELTKAVNSGKLSQKQREQVLRAIDRVKAFQANPPPYLSPKWREVAAELQRAFDKWSKAPQQTGTQPATDQPRPEASIPPIAQTPAPKTAPETKPTTSTPSEQPTPSTPLAVVAVVVVAAIGLLVLLLKRRP